MRIRVSPVKQNLRRPDRNELPVVLLDEDPLLLAGRLEGIEPGPAGVVLVVLVLVAAARAVVEGLVVVVVVGVGVHGGGGVLGGGGGVAPRVVEA